MKLFFKALCCGVVISCLLSLTGFCGACEDIENRVLRLHIIANSDSETDQELKLKVRDEITEYTDQLFAGCKTKDDSIKAAEKNIDSIKEKARSTLEKYGCHDEVDAYITNMSFDTRVYEDFTLPSGNYDALRIVIGEGKGHNWWCVLFPAVCVPSASEDIGSALTEEENEIVHDSDKYIIKFKSIELFQNISDFLSGLF